MGPRIVLTGPSASGKGAVAFEIAKSIDAAIVSVDSMKVYREMDVVTAKPSSERRVSCDYHLIDIVDPDEEFSVGDYSRRLRALLEDSDQEGRSLVLCGGTALYIQAYLRGLADVPAADWEVRERLKAEAAEAGLGVLYERLRSVDPEAAAKFLPEDERRIVRALEVFETTGERLSESWGWADAERAEDCRLFGVGWERPELYRRTDRRVLRMVENGLFEEAQRLLDRQPELGRTARQCIGIKEFREARDTGAGSEEIIETIQKNTRNFVKRQMTWFRKMEIDWISASGELDATAVAQEILRRLG